MLSHGLNCIQAKSCCSKEEQPTAHAMTSQQDFSQDIKSGHHKCLESIHDQQLIQSSRLLDMAEPAVLDASIAGLGVEKD